MGMDRVATWAEGDINRGARAKSIGDGGLFSTENYERTASPLNAGIKSIRQCYGDYPVMCTRHRAAPAGISDAKTSRAMRRRATRPIRRMGRGGRRYSPPQAAFDK